MPVVFDLKFVPRVAEHIRAEHLHYLRRSRFAALNKWVALFLAVFGLVLVAADGPRWANIIWIGLAVPLFFSRLSLAPRLIRWRFARVPKFHVENHLLFGEDGLHYGAGDIDAKVAWEVYDGLIEDEELFLLTYGRSSYSVIPKRCFPDTSSIDAFRELVRGKLKLKGQNDVNPTATSESGNGTASILVFGTLDALPTTSVARMRDDVARHEPSKLVIRRDELGNSASFHFVRASPEQAALRFDVAGYEGLGFRGARTREIIEMFSPVEVVVVLIAKSDLDTDESFVSTRLRCAAQADDVRLAFSRFHVLFIPIEPASWSDDERARLAAWGERVGAEPVWETDGGPSAIEVAADLVIRDRRTSREAS